MILLCFSVSWIFFLPTEAGLALGKRNNKYKLDLEYIYGNLFNLRRQRTTLILTLMYLCKNHLKAVQTFTSVKKQTCINVKKDSTSPTSIVWSVLLVICKYIYLFCTIEE